MIPPLLELFYIGGGIFRFSSSSGGGVKSNVSGFSTRSSRQSRFPGIGHKLATKNTKDTKTAAVILYDNLKPSRGPKNFRTPSLTPPHLFFRVLCVFCGYFMAIFRRVIVPSCYRAVVVNFNCRYAALLFSCLSCFLWLIYQLHRRRFRRRIDHLLDHLVSRQSFRLPLEVQNDAMPHGRQQHVANVLERHVVASLAQRQHFGRQNDRLGPRGEAPNRMYLRAISGAPGVSGCVPSTSRPM